MYVSRQQVRGRRTLGRIDPVDDLEDGLDGLGDGRGIRVRGLEPIILCRGNSQARKRTPRGER